MRSGRIASAALSADAYASGFPTSELKTTVPPFSTYARTFAISPGVSVNGLYPERYSIGFFVGSGSISSNDLMFEVKWTFISPLTHSSSPLRSFGVRVQSSASPLLIFVSSVGGCGGFFFSCRFMGTTG